LAPDENYHCKTGLVDVAQLHSYRIVKGVIEVLL
jgi:hypothetical protein